MGSGRTTFLVLVGLSACAATAVVAREMVIAPKGGIPISDSPKEVMDQAWQIVFRDYLDTTGKYSPDKWRQLRRELLAKTYGSPSQAYEAIRGMLATLSDPYTRFLDPREFKEMQIDTSGELSGVG
ncbi:MAG: peptidase S41, partial [Cyanobium sp.]